MWQTPAQESHHMPLGKTYCSTKLRQDLISPVDYGIGLCVSGRRKIQQGKRVCCHTPMNKFQGQNKIARSLVPSER